MSSHHNLLNLPDLVLYKICTFIECPFDLLHFGNTCSHLRKISSAPSLWWSVAFHWLKGLWIFMEEGSTEDNSRAWLLDIIRQYTTKPSRTKLICEFPNGEQWVREDTPKLRFLFNLVRIAYSNDKDDHPAVLYERWLYDIGVYKRVGPQLNFADSHLELAQNIILQLSSLSQAAERDLCRRKQPFKDHKYYIKPIAVSETAWNIELFPVSHSGSICPLLMCPFQNSLTNEVSGIQGLAMCLSVVLEGRLKRNCNAFALPLQKVWEVVKIFCTIFVSEILQLLPALRNHLETPSLMQAVFAIVEILNLYDYQKLQSILTYSELNFNAKEVIMDLVTFLKKYDGIDFPVDGIRFDLRKSIVEEINKVLFPPCSENKVVSRINLTDSDLIGGDNSRQEMSAAAFISDYGVLVTWHLTGRMRY